MIRRPGLALGQGKFFIGCNVLSSKTGLGDMILVDDAFWGRTHVLASEARFFRKSRLPELCPLQHSSWRR